MDMILLTVMLAITVEGLVEYAKTFIDAIANKDYRTVAIQLCAVYVAILLCFAAGANFYTVLGVNFTYTWVGIVLTGIFLSRGSNYVSDFIQRLQGAKT